MTITKEQLLKIMPFAKSRADAFLLALNECMNEFEINTPVRQAAFLAQIAHESGELRYVLELASGEAYDTGRLAAKLGNTTEDDDDGRKYKGRGLIQITGLKNYRRMSELLGLDLVANPELLEQPHNAVRSAACWWKDHGLNAVADSGDFYKVTKIINGGYNGLPEREKYHFRAQVALEAA